MRKPIHVGLLLLLSAATLFASIDGAVVNRTTNKPQAGVNITLIKPGQGGMKTLGTRVSDGNGRFVFQNDEPGGGPQLLQASYKSVNYNKLLTPNIPTSNVELDVFEATSSPKVARVAERMIIIEPTASQLAVTETVVIQNDTNTTYNNDDLGGLRFYLPPANGQVRINAQGPQGMPLPRQAEKTREADVFKVTFPIKPGQTEFQVNYVLPAGSPFTFHGRMVGVKGMPSGPLRLVAPAGVKLEGKDIQNVGTEPKTQATIYNVLAQNAFSVGVTGTGSLRAGNEATATDDSDSPQVTEGKPQIYRYQGLLIALAFSILGVGVILLFRNSPVRPPYAK